MRIVLIASTLAVLAATASAKNTAAVGQKGKKHNAATRKHRALRNTKAGQRKAAAAGIPADDIRLAAEDEGYWDRFLQAEENSLPTPAPTPGPTAPPTPGPTAPPTPGPTAPPTPPPTPAPTPLGECGVGVSVCLLLLSLSSHMC